MSAVVDASVLVAALVDTGPHGLWAETIIESRPLHAPALLPVEVTRVLRRLERTQRLTTAEANAAHEDLMQLELQLHAFEPFSDRIWELRSGVRVMTRGPWRWLKHLVYRSPPWTSGSAKLTAPDVSS